MIRTVLNVKIDDVSETEALKRVEGWLVIREKLSSRIITTVGPEFLLTAQKDEDFKRILNKADLSLPEGFGLHLAGVRNRVPGVDFMMGLCRVATKNGWTIGLLGGQAGVAAAAAKNLRSQFSELRVVVVIDGPAADRVLSGSDTINSSKPKCDILLVAFGHPRQEKLLWRLRGQYRVGMGVGGAFDYIAGLVPRPPKLVRAIGFEWLWRLLTQKNRFRRIFNAVVVFPIVLLLNHGQVRSG